jgi:hypothetical protein
MASINFHFLKEDNLSIWKIAGEITADQIISKLKEAINHPDFEPGMNCICDCREQKTVWNIEDIYNITLETKFVLGHFKKNIRVAGIFDDNVQYYMGKIYAAYSKVTPVEFAPFKNSIEAKKWLGFPSDAQLL